jgi:hypothetical protein
MAEEKNGCYIFCYDCIFVIDDWSDEPVVIGSACSSLVVRIGLGVKRLMDYSSIINNKKYH